ncbi:tyrosine-type recombinase/integrase [Saccharopolyspora cebuensis]|uniref:Tyrosine-type recombinase/integrase n=1 Tax=Saccharopolyspora cebuensis TaxID=418759 RepID=A0ABV4CA50_9PSEU
MTADAADRCSSPIDALASSCRQRLWIRTPGRARLSYRRAADSFEQTTAKLSGGPWTLHQLRHSALTHAAETGANTSTQLAFSGHTSVASLAKYARVSPQALARWQQARDPAARRP